MEKEVYSPEFALSAEPNPDTDALKVITEQKGVMRIKISASGEGAHGSTPWEGENAAEKLWKKFDELKQNFDCSGAWATTLNLGTFRSGEAMNVVPDEAEASLDVRWIADYGPSEIVEDLEDIDGLEFEVKAEDPQLATSEENPYVRKFVYMAGEEFDAVETGKKEAASDMRHFSERGIPAVVVGPTGGGIHGSGEYVEIDDLAPFYRAVKTFVEEEG